MITLTLGVTSVQAQQTPATGRDVLQVMRAAYGGHWFKTLTFTQATTKRDSSGKESVATWYESLRYTDAGGTQLRIDIGDPKDGNGVLYSTDSLWAFRGGKQVAARAGGNLLLPLIEGVYLQPTDRTTQQMAASGVDFSRAVVTGIWNNRPVWIVGANATGDTASPQFWVDVQTKVVVRGIFSPVATAPVMDMRLDSLVRTGGGWLATRCEFYVAGKLLQAEAYSGWQTNVNLAPELFDPRTWTTAPHWAGKN